MPTTSPTLRRPWYETVNIWMTWLFWAGGWYFRILGGLFLIAEAYNRRFQWDRCLVVMRAARRLVDGVLFWF
jgi:hypothetical protein